MRRKAFLLMVLAAGFMASCVEGEKDLYVKHEAPDVPIENYKFTRAFEVPVEDGKITVVTYNGETIYEGNVATTIQVPNIPAGTRSSGLDWHFVTNEDLTNKWWFTIDNPGAILLFEDLPVGDNDYNDFVCWVTDKFDVNANGNTEIMTSLQLSRLGVFPLAMGNTIPLKFGFEIVNLTNGELIDDIIIYDDIRKEAFEGLDGFINTISGEEPFKLSQNKNVYMPGKTYYPNNVKGNEFAFNYYIIAKGVKHYTANSAKAITTDNNVPFGLYIPGIALENRFTFKYPNETTSIFKAYPNFSKWLEGNSADPFAGGKSEFIYSK